MTTILNNSLKERSDEQKLADVLEKTLNNSTGIIKKFNLVPLQADEPPIHIAMAEFVESTKLPPRRIHLEKWQAISREVVTSGNVFEHQKEIAVHSSGAALDEISALWATIGEAFERYAMTLQINGNEAFAKKSELSSRAIDVDSLVLFTQEQYESDGFLFKQYQVDKAIRWGESVSLVTGETVYIPADLYSPYYPTTETDGPLVACYSTGYAAGPDYPWAMKSGLCEVVERDAFMFYWLSKLTPARLDPNKLESFLPKKLQALFHQDGISVSLHWLKTDVDLPTIVCFVNADRGRGFAMGASTNFSWEVAVEKAILEAYHTLNWTVDLDRWLFDEVKLDSIKDFSDHVRYYLNEDNHHKLEFLIGEHAEDGTADFIKEYAGRNVSLETAIKQIASLGYEPLVVDRTGEDLKTIDIVVSCVVIPGMQPLHVGLGNEHRDRKRLEKIADGINCKLPESLNLEPHPFP